MTIYVSTTGNDSTGDGSQSNPYRTIGKALDEVISAAESNNIIYIENGTYTNEPITKILPANCTVLIRAVNLPSINEEPKVTIEPHYTGDNQSWIWVNYDTTTLKLKGLKIHNPYTTHYSGIIRSNTSASKGYVEATYCHFYGNDKNHPIAFYNYLHVKAYKCTFRNLYSAAWTNHASLDFRDCIFEQLSYIYYGATSVTFDYNCQYNVTNTATCTGSNCLSSNPQFTSSTDYSISAIQSSSPCKDAGTTITGYIDTYDGSAPDIGMYEVSTTVSSSFTFYSKLSHVISSTFSFFSTLLKTVSSSFQFSSFLSKSFSFHSVLQKIHSSTFSFTSRLLKTFSNSYLISSFLHKIVRTFYRSYLQWNLKGVISAGQNQEIPLVVAGPSILQKVFIYCKTLGSSGQVVLDINKNGSSIFGASKPAISSSDSNHWIEAYPTNNVFHDGDILSLDIDSADSGFSDISVVLVFEDLLDVEPKIKELQIREAQFITNLGDNQKGWISSSFNLKIIFNSTMDANYVPTVTGIALNFGGHDFVISTGKWATTYMYHDTWITSSINLDSSYIGKYILQVDNIKTFYGKEFYEQISFELVDRNLAVLQSQYTKNGKVILLPLFSSISKISYSLDGINYSGWLSYDKEVQLDLLDSSLGGNSSEGEKQIYLKFKQNFATITYLLKAYYYHSSLQNFTLSYSRSHLNSLRINYNYSNSFLQVPMDRLEIYLNGAIYDTLKPTFSILEGLDWEKHETLNISNTFADGSYDSSHTPDKAFDNDSGTYWRSQNTSLPHYIGIEFTTPRIIKYYQLDGDIVGGDNGERPKYFKLEASNDNINWVVVDDRTSVEHYGRKLYVRNLTQSYKYYRIVITETQNGGNIVSIPEITFTINAIKITAGIYMDKFGKLQSIPDTIFDIPTRNPSNNDSLDRIDLYYLDLADNSIHRVVGSEGLVSYDYPYSFQGDGSNIVTSQTQWPSLPDFDFSNTNYLPLFYIYSNYKPLYGEDLRLNEEDGFVRYKSYRFFYNRGNLSYAIPFTTFQQTNTIEIKQIDVLSREISKSITYILTNTTKVGKIKGTYNNTEILSGEITSVPYVDLEWEE